MILTKHPFKARKFIAFLNTITNYIAVEKHGRIGRAIIRKGITKKRKPAKKFEILGTIEQYNESIAGEDKDDSMGDDQADSEQEAQSAPNKNTDKLN